MILSMSAWARVLERRDFGPGIDGSERYGVFAIWLEAEGLGYLESEEASCKAENLDNVPSVLVTQISMKVLKFIQPPR